MRDRMNVYFPPELLKQISDLADRKKIFPRTALRLPGQDAEEESGGRVSSVTGRGGQAGGSVYPSPRSAVASDAEAGA
jgi:hypothetical protein